MNENYENKNKIIKFFQKCIASLSFTQLDLNNPKITTD
jgi:hypothetical protein